MLFVSTFSITVHCIHVLSRHAALVMDVSNFNCYVLTNHCHTAPCNRLGILALYLMSNNIPVMRYHVYRMHRTGHRQFRLLDTRMILKAIYMMRNTACLKQDPSRCERWGWGMSIQVNILHVGTVDPPLNVANSLIATPTVWGKKTSKSGTALRTF